MKIAFKLMYVNIDISICVCIYIIFGYIYIYTYPIRISTFYPNVLEVLPYIRPNFRAM
jgi:hypothetical protein